MNFIPKIARRVPDGSLPSSHARARHHLFYLCLIVFLLSPLVDIGTWLAKMHWHSIYAPSAIHSASVWLGSVRTGNDAGDSWDAMRAVLDWYEQHPGGRFYEQVFFIDHTKFQYPPSSLLVFKSLSLIGLDPTNRVLNEVNWWFIAVNAGVNALFAFTLTSRSHDYRAFRVPFGLAAAFATLFYYPTTKAFELGQLQVWINAIFSVAALAWLTGRKSVAGVLIGAICLMKPQFALFALWGLLRREWAFVIGGGIVALAGSLAAVAMFGWQNHVDYLSVLRALSRTGEEFVANQSFNGLLNRAFATDDPYVWQLHGFPPYNPVVYIGTLITSAIMVLAALLVPRRGEGASDLLDFLCAALTFTIASPIAWDHHFGLLPVIYCAVMFVLLCRRSLANSKWCLPALAASFLLTGHWLGGSWTLLGVLGLLGVMHWANYKSPPVAPSDVWEQEAAAQEA